MSESEGGTQKGAETDVDGDEVLEGLGHLETFDVEVTGVEEVVNPLSAVVVGLRIRFERDVR